MLCSNLHLLRIYAVWDYDAYALSNDFIGFLEIEVDKLSKGSLIPLKPPPEPHNQNAGSLQVVDIVHHAA